MLTSSVSSSWAQSLIKEATNSFARYGKTQDAAELVKAREQVDKAYSTRKDSLGYRNNLVRAMIYSTLAATDSLRNYKYSKDPIEETTYSMSRIASQKYLDEHESEVAYIDNQLARAYLFNANRALSDSRFYEAFTGYRKVNELSPGDASVIHNLAVISEKLGYKEEALDYFGQLIEAKPGMPDYYLTMADLYTDLHQAGKMSEILLLGHRRFPENRDLLFKLLNTYADNQDYQAVVSIVDDALKLDADNLSLNYLAGFSYDFLGNQAKAQSFYKKMLEIDPNSYDGNYALGLLFLNSYLRNTKDESQLFLAKRYLSKANEIDPNDIKGLRALVVLYKQSGDMMQLQKLNSKLNELILN
ncbi:MAG TPA: TRAFs-binding domain-containing protein [Sphingobacteriaceae bacterium]